MTEEQLTDAQKAYLDERVEEIIGQNIQGILKEAFAAGHFEGARSILVRMIKHDPESELTVSLMAALPRHPYLLIDHKLEDLEQQVLYSGGEAFLQAMVENEVEDGSDPGLA